MSYQGNVHQIHPAPSGPPSVMDVTEALEDTLDLSDRLATEMKRLGEGITALRDEWAAEESADLRGAADRLHELLVGRS